MEPYNIIHPYIRSLVSYSISWGKTNTGC